MFDNKPSTGAKRKMKIKLKVRSKKKWWSLVMSWEGI